MKKLLNIILESSGMSPLIFGGGMGGTISPLQPGPTEPLKQFGEITRESAPTLA
jgi:hypothetical protein